MLLRQLLEVYEWIDRPNASGAFIAQQLSRRGEGIFQVQPVQTPLGKTDFVKVGIPGRQGKSKKGTAPTLGIVGRLGGVGARPEKIGMVSDGDGALVALTLAAKLLDMQKLGDTLAGDVIISTHICPNAPTEPHDPVPFMGSPVSMEECNRQELDSAMDAVLSIDTTKGNQVICHNGIAISPTVMQGYILKTSPDLLEILQYVTGRMPHVFPLATQDITPYGNNLDHLNSILQPAVATKAPVVGLAITAEIPVPGCATGASRFVDVEEAARFALEVCKEYGQEKCTFYDAEEFALLQQLYGNMTHLQSMGNQ